MIKILLENIKKIKNINFKKIEEEDKIKIQLYLNYKMPNDNMYLNNFFNNNFTQNFF